MSQPCHPPEGEQHHHQLHQRLSGYSCTRCGTTKKKQLATCSIRVSRPSCNRYLPLPAGPAAGSAARCGAALQPAELAVETGGVAETAGLIFSYMYASLERD